jgi:RNA polymerase sigma factor (sigma-70 family)
LGSNGLCVADKSTDELLRDFVSQNGASQGAFEEIVRRYAGMVYSVCLQVTRDVHDAEDATQAAFLTLALRAKTAENIKYLGPWLQKVARRLSLDIMRAKKRRKRREERRGEMNTRLQPDRDPRSGMDRAETADIVRDELNKLPSKYRLPLILHYFGGLRPEEVARELGYKPSTLGVRLHRGRKMLADNLAERGVTISSALLATLLAGIVHQGIADNVIAHTSMAAAGIAVNGELPAAIISSRIIGLTRQAAAALFWAKAKFAMAVVLLATGAFAGGVQIVRNVVPVDLSLDRLNPLRWIAPLFKSVVPSPHVNAVLPDQRNNAAMAVDAPVEMNPPVHVDERSSIVPAATAAPAQLTANTATVGVSTGAASVSLAQAAQVEPPRDLLPPLGSPIAVASVPRSDPAAWVYDAATRSVNHTSGLRRFDQMFVDSRRAGSVENYILSGNGQIIANNLTVGDAGRGNFHQRGGRVQTGRLTLGARPTGSGRYVLEDGQLTATHETIGDAGSGQFVQNGGTNQTTTLDLAAQAGSSGTYAQNGGSLAAEQINVGVRGTGSFQHNEGVIATNTLTIGQFGEGLFEQNGGTLDVSTIQLGYEPQSNGTLALNGGEVRLHPAGAVVVGLAGSGTVLAGNAQGSANFYEAPPDSRANLTVRSQPTGAGIIRGSGEIVLTGEITQNGRVIADGFNWPRDLDLSHATRVTNTIDNPQHNGANGWFAENGGKLVLPPLQVSPDAPSTWGEDPGDPVLDLVNSIRFRAQNVRQPGEAVVSLLATDHVLIPQYPPDEHFIGVWAFSRRGLDFENGEVLIRYDDLAVSALYADESTLHLWAFDDKWSLITGQNVVLDAQQNLIGGTLPSDFRLIGVSLPEGMLPGVVAAIPEPASAAVLLACGALLRRRRAL